MSKAERTRQFIIEKTAPIFNVKGYAGTSLSDMTAATGLTKGSIYGNFANKDEVALEAFDHNIGQIQSAIKAEIGKAVTFRDKLLVYVEVYSNFLNYPFPEGGCPILNTAVEADDTHERLRKKAAEALMEWKNTMVSIIEQGIASGAFHADVNAEDMALGIIATIEGSIMIAQVTGKVHYRLAIMRTVEKMIRTLI